MMDAAQLESGTGLSCGTPQDGLGDGAGKWRLAVESDKPPGGDEPAVEPGRATCRTCPARRRRTGRTCGTCTCSRRRPTRSGGRASCARSTALRATIARPRCWPTTTPTRDTTRCGCRSARGRTAHFDSDDLELGRQGEGPCRGRTGAGAGTWRLTLYGLGRGARLRARGGRLPGGHERDRAAEARSVHAGGVLQSRHQPPHERAAAGEPLLARGGGVDRAAPTTWGCVPARPCGCWCPRPTRWS